MPGERKRYECAPPPCVGHDDNPAHSIAAQGQEPLFIHGRQIVRHREGPVVDEHRGHVSELDPMFLDVGPSLDWIPLKTVALP